jgi:small subunit ribosomal protein S4
MGDIRRKHRKFSRPRQLFNRGRMDEENELVEKYGLKNKREIWKAKTKISDIRRRAKNLINSKNESARNDFFAKLNNMGFSIKQTSDVLGLTEQDLLERRLQTIVFKKGLANTPKQARQLIVHKHVLVNGSVVNTPSMWVGSNDESQIELKPQKIKVVKEETPASEEEE